MIEIERENWVVGQTIPGRSLTAMAVDQQEDGHLIPGTSITAPPRNAPLDEDKDCTSEDLEEFSIDDGNNWFPGIESSLGMTFWTAPDGQGVAQLRKQVFRPISAVASLDNLGVSAVPDLTAPAEHGLIKDFPQIGLWRRLSADPMLGTRLLVGGSQSSAAAIAALGQTAPNFSSLTEIVCSAINASAITRTALRLPPILLLGQAGIGKTYIAARIAHAIGTQFRAFTMTNMTGVNPLGGTAAVWKKPQLGLVAKTLIEGETANPLIVLEEIDKAFCMRGDADPLGPLHELWEAEAAAKFADEFLEMPVAADSILWLATANSTEHIAPSILDRLLILRIKPPSTDQMQAIIDAIYGDVIKPFGPWFAPTLPQNISTLLAATHPRRAKRLLDLACSHAASLTRQELQISDIEAAIGVFADPAAHHRIGFLP